MAKPRKDFFVSYSRADRAWAEWIAWQLEEAGYTTVLQAWDFRPGGNFVLDMQQATMQAERTIAVLSEDFLAAAFTQPEWAAAFVRDPTGVKSNLVPVRVRACNPEGLLRAITYIDLIDADDATRHLQRNVSSVASAGDVRDRALHRIFQALVSTPSPNRVLIPVPLTQLKIQVPRRSASTPWRCGRLSS